MPNSGILHKKDSIFAHQYFQSSKIKNKFQEDENFGVTPITSNEKSFKMTKNSQKKYDHSYLNEFFGLTSKPVEIILDPPIAEQISSNVPIFSFITYKENTKEELEVLMDNNLNKGNSMNDNNCCIKKNLLTKCEEEWRDHIKESRNNILFQHPNSHNNLIWMNNIKNTEINDLFRTTQTHLYFKLKTLNSNKLEDNTDLLKLFKLDQLEAPMSQKSILECLLHLINHLKEHNMNHKLRGSCEYDNCIINFAVSYLGGSFKNYMKLYINKMDPARKFTQSLSNDRADITSPIQMIKILYKLTVPNEEQHAQDSVYGGVSIWFLLYHLIRTGDYETAIDVADNLSPLYKILTIMLHHLSNNTSIKLSQKELEQFHRLSILRLKENSDCYEKLLLCLFSFKNMDSHELFNPIETIEEFVWFKTLRLKLSYLLNPSTISYPLLMLNEELMSDFANFDKNMKPSIFSQAFCLFLIGSFENAIAILSKDEVGIIYAVYSSILLYKYNLINLTLHSHQPMILHEDVAVGEKNKDKVSQNVAQNVAHNVALNVAPILSDYFMKLSSSSSSSPSRRIFVINYFIALHQVKSKEIDMITFTSKCFISKFSQFERILSYAWLNEEEEDSAAYPTNQKNQDEFVICVKGIANYCRSAYEHLIALSLYINIDDYNNATDCMIDILIDIILRPKSYQPHIISDIISKGRNLGDKILYKSSTEIKNSQSLLLLLDLCLFFNEFSIKHYQSAYKIIKALLLIPTKTSQIEECLQRLQNYPKKFKLIIKDILYAASTIMNQIYHQCKYETAKLDPAMVTQMKEQSAAILSFTSKLPYNLPKWLTTKLITELCEIRK